MVSVIGFGVVTSKIIYPILTTITSLLINISTQITTHLDKKQPQNQYQTHFSFRLFLLFLAECLAIFVYIFQKSKKSKSDIVEKRQISNIVLFLLLAFCALLDIMVEIFDFWIAKHCSDFEKNISRGMLIVVIIILSKYSLGIQLYRHHMIGIGIYLVGLVINSFTEKEDISNWYFLLMILGETLTIAGQIIIEKYLIEKKYVNEYLVLGGEGIIGFVLSIGIMLVSDTIQCPLRSQFCNEGKSFDSFEVVLFLFKNYKYLLVIILGICCDFMYNISRILMTYHYIPAYYIIPKNFQVFLLWILKVAFMKSVNFSIVTLIVYIIELFGLLVLLEIITIKLFGINKNVEGEIRKRQTEDISVGLVPFTYENEAIM